MATESIVALLVAERDKLNRAIEALQGTGQMPSAVSSAQKKRFITAATRRKMALGQKKRYAALKAATT
jgi:hypothetical protein